MRMNKSGLDQGSAEREKALKILDLFETENSAQWLALIEKSDWRAGAFLAGLVRNGSFYETLGEGSKVLLLTEGDELISYCTFAKYDDIRPTELTPWVGFVYTFPAWRGRGCIGRLFDEVGRLAEERGVEEVYLSTNHVGLYEKYGFEFKTMLNDLEGVPSRIYSLKIGQGGTGTDTDSDTDTGTALDGADKPAADIRVIEADERMADGLAVLAAEFRCVLRSYRGERIEPDIEAGREELLEYLHAGYPVYAALAGDALAGYAVCRVDGGVVWVEHLYVREAWRRRGVASLLYDRAEAFSESLGNDTAFNWVHPNNDGIIAFLRSRGYTVLNLIEIRKPFAGEKPASSVRVDDHRFDY